MSPRAAARLESFGFSRVYDYVVGKEDWTAAGLPTEGTLDYPRAIDFAVRDVVTCGLTDRLADVNRRLQEAGRRVCIVVNERSVVLGRLRGEVLQRDPQSKAEDVMEIGPTTFRADVDVKTLVGRMQERRVGSVLITDADGRLLGIFYRAEGERVLAGES